MEQYAAEIMGAIFKGDFKGLVMVLAVFAITHYGTFAAAYAGTKLVALWNFLRGKGNEYDFLANTELDDKFFDLLERAVSNQTYVNESLAESVADGTLDEEDLKRVLDAIWLDFKANLGVSDWKGFGLQLLGKASAPGTEAAVRAKFNANVRSSVGEISNAVAARQFQFRTAQRNFRAFEQGPEKFKAGA